MGSLQEDFHNDLPVHRVGLNVLYVVHRCRGMTGLWIWTRSFALSDRKTTEQLTIRDLLSHRSGSPTSSGDVLEDLGFIQPTILHQIRLLPVTGSFRKTYKYSNFGYTEGCIAAAKAAEQKWEDLAEQRLFKPLEMKSTSYR
jgi:CubicO group peptidase (beta-lactamase class C family)